MGALAGALIAAADEVYGRLCEKYDIDAEEDTIRTALAEEIARAAGVTFGAACEIEGRVWAEAATATMEQRASIIARHAGVSPARAREVAARVPWETGSRSA